MNRRVSALLMMVVIWQSFRVAGLAATSILNPLVTPVTITFSANDPDIVSVPGNLPGTISFRTTGGSSTRSWQVQIQAVSGASFGSCPSTVPISQVLVTCVSATATGSATASCSAPSNLSTGLQTIASGTEDNGSINYTVTVNFTFQDSWRFIATTSPCSVSLQYLITAN